MTRTQYLSSKRWVRCALAAVVVVLALPLARSSSSAELLPPAGTVTRIADLPDDFAKFDPIVDKQNHAGEPSATTLVLADPATHLIFEVNTANRGTDNPQAKDCVDYARPAAFKSLLYPLAEWAVYDARTSTRVAAVCGLPVLVEESTLNDISSLGSAAVIDTTDKVIFTPCICGNGLYAQARSILAVGEQPLGIAGDFCLQDLPLNQCSMPQQDSASGSSASLPVTTGPDVYVQGLSWYAPGDDLIALTDNMASHSTSTVDQNLTGLNQPNAPTGVAVTDYHVSSQGGVLNLTQHWSVHIPPNICNRSLTNPLGTTAAAYRSENPDDPALFIPCATQLVNASGAKTPPVSTVVKLKLRPDGAPVGDPLSDPTVKMEVVVAPVPSEDFLFDAKSERGYMLPTNTSDTGMSLAVYDGGDAKRASGFTSRVRVAGSAFNAYGFDNTTGRLYVDDPLSDGLMLVDGRLKQGQGYAAYPYPGFATGMNVATWNIATLPPDDAHPYTRVILPNVTDVDMSTSIPPLPQEHMRSLTVLADRVPVSTDAPPASVDSNTYSGQIPAGADVSTAYSGHASGYGIHVTNVGGYWGAVENAVGGRPAPLPAATDPLDLAGGAVPESKLADGTAQATATSLSDVNGNAARTYRACTNGLSPLGCDPPPGCAVPGHGDPCGDAVGGVSSQPCPSPDTTAGRCQQLEAASTAQQWPYPTAQCSDPGPQNLEGNHVVHGTFYTPEHSTDPSATPEPQQAAPVDSGASARADCSDGRVVAAGQLGCSRVSLPDASHASPPDVGCDGSPQDLSIGGANLAPQITVANAWTTTSISPPVGGVVVSTVTAVAQGIHIDLLDGASLSITQVEQDVWAEAGGRSGTAHTNRHVSIQGITLHQPGEPDSQLCVDSAGCSGDQGLLDKLNELDPSHLYVILPQPDEPFGTERDGISPAGSPGGYLAQVWASGAEQQGDKQFNDMNGWSGTEQELLPALRIVFNNPGEATESRLVLDWAGVEADASLGVQVNDASVDASPTSVEATQAMVEAGVPPSQTYVPGTTGLPGQSPVAANVYPSGLLGVLERALTGLGWLVRSPLGGLQMAAFLMLLGLPVALMRRRWAGR